MIQVETVRGRAERPLWRSRMRVALAEIEARLQPVRSSVSAPGEHRSRRILRFLVAQESTGGVRDPGTILEEWRTIQHADHGAACSGARDVIDAVLRAEYASAFLQRSESARELAQYPSAPGPGGGTPTDPRARETADELVATLWDEVNASARVAFYDPGTPEHDGAIQDRKELGSVIAALERTLKERPWTEEA